MVSPPIHLELRTVALAAKKAFDEGRLSAQGPTPACEYRDCSGLPCAIGAALSDDFARGLPKNANVWAMRETGLITTDDFEGLRNLQDAHDRWTDEPSSPERKAKFESLLTSILGEQS